MSTIIVYKRNGSNPITLTAAERQEGMKDAGDKLRIALSQSAGSTNDTDADDRIKDVIDGLIDAKNAANQNIYDVRFEENRLNPIKYKLEGKIDRRGRHILTHPDNIGVAAPDLSKNGKLRLDVGLDDQISTKNIFKMRLTVPRSAGDSTSWIYLSNDINADLNVIETVPNPATRVQNYLISTFMFSRCR